MDDVIRYTMAASELEVFLTTYLYKYILKIRLLYGQQFIDSIQNNLICLHYY